MYHNSMRLLVITQVLDQDDQYLGFFHQWVAELAKHSDISVICLREGKHNLPSNVSVYSLGKPSSRLMYVWRFFRYITSLKYDKVLVHMNQEYVLLGGWLWKLKSKKIFMWRNHYAGSLLTDIAAAFCIKVFCTSKFSYTKKYKKTVLMPVGIDTGVYKPAGEPVPNSILFFGRLAPSKRPELLLSALPQVTHKYSVTFAGPSEAPYVDALKKKARGLNVEFKGGVPAHQAPALYSAHEIFVNCSPSGMYDKTIFEAAACGCLVIASSKDWAALVDPAFSFEEGNANDLAQKLDALLAFSPSQKSDARRELMKVAETQNLSNLAYTLAQELI
jgi:glycosyltransferase involved in cell wall biosynthesis